VSWNLEWQKKLCVSLFAGSRVQAYAAEELQTKPLEEDNETHEQTWGGTLSTSSTTEINQTKYPFL
jgi:hypothetical protein